MVDADELDGGEWAEWYALTPVERWAESEKLWVSYLALGGSLDPNPDLQSPFYDLEEWLANWDGKPILKVSWKSGVEQLSIG